MTQTTGDDELDSDLEIATPLVRDALTSLLPKMEELNIAYDTVSFTVLAVALELVFQSEIRTIKQTKMMLQMMVEVEADYRIKVQERQNNNGDH